MAKRLKALDLSDKEAIIANYDPKSDEFKDIAARSAETDSNCMYGTSFLVFERTTGRFLELFFGTKSARPIAGDLAVYLALSQADIDRKDAAGADVSQMKPHGPQPCTLKARLAKNKRGHSWHVPDVQECSTPFSNLPAANVIADEITRVLDGRQRRGRDGEGGAGQEGSRSLRVLCQGTAAPGSPGAAVRLAFWWRGGSG